MTPLPASRLRCEYLAEPLGVDTPTPRISWLAESPTRGDLQKAFKVLVASARELLQGDIGDFWDTGMIDAEKTASVEYRGEALQSCTRYFWKVRWWNREGAASPWSEPASFVTGFLYEGDWKPKWIASREVREFRSKGTVLLGHPGADDTQACAIYLRREFRLKEKASLAMVFISGLGHYELRLNGEKVGSSVLDPGWTDYKKKALYASHDVTALVRDKNAVGVILGNGRHTKSYSYEPPKLTCRIEVEYESGERAVIFSDESWKTSGGPLRENGLYYGERYDARLLIDGWDQPGFDDRSWDKALATSGYPLVSQMMPPVRVTEHLDPKSVTRVAPGAFVFDFGQNFAGWVRLRVEGPKGTEIRLRHAELLNDDGSLNFGPNENAEATDVYILKGGGPEVYEPRFTYHGFRYAEMTGFPGEPGPGAVEGCFAHSDVERTGTFNCSNELLNRVHRNIVWGQLSNLMSIPTDCPQRDERHGWLGDAHLSAEEAVFNFGMAAFYTKFLDDIRLAQREDGSLPDVVPPYLPRLYPADPAWSSAYPTLVWLLWEHYADGRVIAMHYASLKKYIDFLGQNADRLIVRKLGKYGDWCPPGGIVPKKTPVDLTSTWYYYHDVLLVARMAAVLGRKEEALQYTKLADSIRDAFNETFLGETQYAAIRVSPVDNYPNQTSNALPLYLNMVPAEKIDKVLASLLQSVIRQQDFHVDTGILGTRYILDVLTDYGHAEVAYRMATHKSYPGWGYMLAEDATTLWERWEKLTGHAMNSQNHIMLGSIDAWFYRVIAGLSPGLPGWRTVRIRPHTLGGLVFAEAKLETVAGMVRSAWTRSEDSFSLEVSIPVGAAGEVHVPLLWPGALIFESDRLLWKTGRACESVPEVVLAAEDPGDGGKRVVFKTRSGQYRFKLKKSG
ncbi:MAG: glycoside hydrolase family 78 protein [Candidatus Aminicenantes bacterium]|nr:glycoside hydrolase family 78 protein [Candidatus Aminicenantes bacterium]